MTEMFLFSFFWSIIKNAPIYDILSEIQLAGIRIRLVEFRSFSLFTVSGGSFGLLYSALSTVVNNKVLPAKLLFWMTAGQLVALKGICFEWVMCLNDRIYQI